MRIGIVVGETSGDNLGVALMQALRVLHPDITFEGIPGPKMIAAGCGIVESMEKIAVMGFLEPLKRLPTILQVRKNILSHFLKNPPDIFVGIDAPDFNLSIERRLKAAGIKTVHYVSPSVWGWRQGRIHKIKKSVDLMLTLFPFETPIYKDNNIPVEFVGHPLADAIPLEYDIKTAKKALNLLPDHPVLALLPGSRHHELHQLAESFIQTAIWCQQRLPGLQIVTAMANHSRRQQFETMLQKIAPHFKIHIIDQRTHEVIAASDVILAASGTVTLEAMLFQKPMVVAYRMWRLTYSVLKKLVKTKYFALPNLIADEPLVPELLQKEVTPEVMGPLLLSYLKDSEKRQALEKRFAKLHQRLKRNGSAQAAQAILKLYQTK